MRFPATCTASNPHGKRHADKEEQRARQGDPTPHARARRAAQLHKREPRSTRSLPSQPPSTQPRTFEVEPCERPVLLERDRQSSRAVVADLIVCGVHSTQPTHGKRHAPTRGSHVPGNGTRRTRAAQLQARVSHCIVRAPARGRRPPWDRATSLPSQPPSTQPRTSEIEPCERPVLLERDRQSSRAVGADAIPCGVHSTRPTRQASHADKEEPRARQRDPTPHARARPTAQARVSPTAQASLALHCAPARGRRPWAHAQPPQPPSTELRTSEAERLERRVLLEQGRKSSRADIAEALSCGVRSTQPKRQASQLKGPRNRGKRTRRTAERARAHISMVPHVRLPSGPAPTRPPSSVGPVRSSSVDPSRIACSHAEISMSTARGTRPSTAAASKAASSHLSPAAALACCLSTSSGSMAKAPAPILVDWIGWIGGRPCASRITSPWSGSSGTEVEAPAPMLAECIG